ncbi:hypothetical protein AB0M46_03770 [Dactylosporangium sp. NPDC051485]|uniref:hypothetical protein n=1 Tax=Dactylosporangium sp. NPDC051485 TaxID=3154846 RepID=UPI00344776B2
MAVEEEPLSPIAGIDLRYLNAKITEDEGDLILLIDDGEVQVEFTSGMGGSWQQAIVGAQRMASTALEYAASLRRRPARE